jgi:hypothetical protein
MDDQLMEKRIDSLKKAYNEIPEGENRSAILAAIKKDQKRKNRNKWFHLPYAASFIGVGLIAGILMMQYISDHGPNPGEYRSGEHSKAGEVKAVHVEEQFEMVEKYFYSKQAEVEEKLGLSLRTVEIPLAPQLLNDIDDTKANALDNLENYNQDELMEMKQHIKERIDETFTLPSEVIEKFHGDDRDRYGDMELEQQLLLQLEYYQSVYWHSDITSLFEKELKKESAARLAEKLNSGGKGIKNDQLRSLAAEAKANGYYFKGNEAGAIQSEINYSWVADQLKSNVHEDFITYLELRNEKIHDHQGRVLSYQKLGELLVKYEKVTHTLTHEMIKEWMIGDVKSYYAEFVHGSNPSAIFDEHNVLKFEVKEAFKSIMKVYPKTDTGKSIKRLYEELERNNFQKPTDFDNQLVSFPIYMVAPNNLKNEDVYSNILPLTNGLLSSYKEFSSKKDWNILKQYNPFEIMSLYFHADEQGDYETMYALYSQNEAMPTLEQFLKKQGNGSSLGNVLRGYQFATLFYAEDDPGKPEGVQLHYTEDADSLIFQMTQEDGIWKVRYMPFQ